MTVEEDAAIAARLEKSAASMSLLTKIETIVSQWRRKMWTDAQALGNIENAILKHNAAATKAARDGAKP